MKNKSSVVIALVFIFCSCRYDKETAGYNRDPLVLEAKGYVVPEDNMAVPKVIPVDENKLKKVPVGKPTIVPVNTNIHAAAVPRVTPAGTPRIVTPGTGIFALPKIIPAINHPSIARNPDIVAAKDMAGKDQNPESFSYFGRLQGLKDNLVTSIVEDKSGNLWFGTNAGVSKYDGKFFTNYNEKQGLLNDIIWSILEDKDGNFWFGTNGGGVSKFDGKSFTNYTDKEGLSNNSVSGMLQDKSGSLWLGTYGGGVNKYDGKSFTHYTHKEGLSNNTVFSILEDKNGNLWFGTNGSGVSKFDGKSFTNYTNKEGLSNDTVLSILEDKNGNLWFGTNGGGVNKFDGKFFINYTDKQGLCDNRISSMLEDKKGNLWFGTTGGGVSKFNGKFFTHYAEKEGLPNNHVTCIFEDKSGNLWFGSFGGGVSKFDGRSFTHYIEKEGLSSPSVFSILKDKNGNLWFGKYGGGVSKFDGKFFVHYTQKEGLPGNDVTSILEDKSGNLWFGTGGSGVAKYDGKYLTHFTEKEGLSSNRVWCIFEDSRGNLWFGTWGSGVSKYDGKSFTHYTEKEGLSNNIVVSIFEDKNGNLWLGTRGGGVCKYNGKSFTRFAQKEGMPGNNVGSTLQDKSGNLWFGTWGGGISKYDGKSFTHYTEKEGLSSNDVVSILEDKSGNLWFGTTKGISCLALSKPKGFPGKVKSETMRESNIFFKNFTYADGFLGIAVNIGKTMLEDQRGDIWIGANDRLTVLHPSGLTGDTGAVNIQLNNIELFNENINWTSVSNNKDSSFILTNGIHVRHLEFDSLKRWYNVPEHLSLAYDNNYLTFHYIGITTYRPQQVKYQYKLEGLDKNWSGLTNRTEATYGNLSHGHYTFKAKAINSEGYWSDELSYSFTIRPPWWLTWWAYLSYILVIGLSMWSYIKFRERNLKARQRALEDTVTIRTNQLEQKTKQLEEKSTVLEQSLSSLKSAQAQLIQSEKMASLGELTAGIAHEIQNPLNFVNNFSEVNKELVDELQNELKAGSVENAFSISNDIKDNEEKINHHGKRADAIVKGMLQHSRVSAGQKEPTDINALADEYLRLSYHGLRAKDKTFNATFKTDFDDTIGKINIVPQDIGRVLLNLYNNAFYAVDEKKKNPHPLKGGAEYEPTVSVSTKLLNSPLGDGGKVEIKVEDNGNGIPQKILDKIFQPFFTTKPTGQGTGLGLSLSYDIVKAHGGEIKVETKESEGSEFIIQLAVNNHKML